MPDWNDDLEAEEERARRKDVRRAVLGGVAGVAMLVAPIVLANTLVPADSNDDVKAEENSGTTLAALRKQAEDQQAAQETARAEAATALRTTTTPPPPPPPPPTTTTTEPPTTTTAPPTTTEPLPPSSGGGLGDPYDYASWDALAECESGGNWATNTGNGYYGGIQFALSTWESLGGTGLPSDHPRETQIQMGIKLWERAGWGQWPACSAELGYR